MHTRGEQWEMGPYFGSGIKIEWFEMSVRGAMTASSIRYYMDRTHRIFLPHTRGVDVGRGVPENNVVYFMRVLNSLSSP